MLALCENKFSKAVAIELHALELERDGLPNYGFLLWVAHVRKHRVLQALLQ